MNIRQTPKNEVKEIKHVSKFPTKADAKLGYALHQGI